MSRSGSMPTRYIKQPLLHSTILHEKLQAHTIVHYPQQNNHIHKKQKYYAPPPPNVLQAHFEQKRCSHTCVSLGGLPQVWFCDRWFQCCPAYPKRSSCQSKLQIQWYCRYKTWKLQFNSKWPIKMYSNSPACFIVLWKNQCKNKYTKKWCLVIVFRRKKQKNLQMHIKIKICYILWPNAAFTMPCQYRSYISIIN